MRAVVSLDQRYGNVPGWDFLASPGRLLLAAEDCALLNVAYDLDDSVDRTLRPAALPKPVFDYLSPRKHISYFVENAGSA